MLKIRFIFNSCRWRNLENTRSLGVSKRETRNVWTAIVVAFVLSTLALPTCTGFFFAIYLFPGLVYLPIGLVTLGVLVASFILLERIKSLHESLAEGLRDSIKLNLFLGILAWTFYFMPTFAPIVGRFF